MLTSPALENQPHVENSVKHVLENAKTSEALLMVLNEELNELEFWRRESLRFSEADKSLPMLLFPHMHEYVQEESSPYEAENGDSEFIIFENEETGSVGSQTTDPFDNVSV